MGLADLDLRVDHRCHRIPDVLSALPPGLFNAWAYRSINGGIRIGRISAGHPLASLPGTVASPRQEAGAKAPGEALAVGCRCGQTEGHCRDRPRWVSHVWFGRRGACFELRRKGMVWEARMASEPSTSQLNRKSSPIRAPEENGRPLAAARLALGSDSETHSC